MNKQELEIKKKQLLKEYRKAETDEKALEIYNEVRAIRILLRKLKNDE